MISCDTLQKLQGLLERLNSEDLSVLATLGVLHEVLGLLGELLGAAPLDRLSIVTGKP